MQAEKLCHKWLSNVLPEMHRSRLETLSLAVSSALRGGRLSVTSVGRWLMGIAKTKHNIKRADRLLSNNHLHSELKQIYSKLSQQILGTEKYPIILIDWSDVDARRKFFLLRAAVAVKGRSLTLYEEVHTRATKEKRRTHSKFLKNLQAILPMDCTPIIVTDAGFRTPWFKQVLSLGWNFVGRVRNTEKVQLAQNSPWIGGKTLYSAATSKAKLFADTLLTQSNALPCSLVLFKGKPKNRKHLTKMGKNARDTISIANAKRAKEPWLLATSLCIAKKSTKEIVKVYSTRMQIEESFRDLKCAQYGLSLYHNRTYKIQRLRVLILIGSIACNFAWLIGSVARTLQIHRQFQANTTSHTSVLSNTFIGIQIFRNTTLKIPWKELLSIGNCIEIRQLNAGSSL